MNTPVTETPPIWLLGIDPRVDPARPQRARPGRRPDRRSRHRRPGHGVPPGRPGTGRAGRRGRGDSRRPRRDRAQHGDRRSRAQRPAAHPAPSPRRRGHHRCVRQHAARGRRNPSPDRRGGDRLRRPGRGSRGRRADARPGAAHPPARRRPRRPRLRRPLVGRDPGAGPPRGRLPLRLLLRRRRPARPVPAGHRAGQGRGTSGGADRRTHSGDPTGAPPWTGPGTRSRRRDQRGPCPAHRRRLRRRDQPASLLGSAGADARGRHGAAVTRRAGQPWLGRCRWRDRPAQLLRLLPTGSRRTADLRWWAGALPDRRPAPGRGRSQALSSRRSSGACARVSRGWERCPSRHAGRGSPVERWTGFPWSGRCGTIRACTSQAGGADTVWRCASTPPSGTPRSWPRLLRTGRRWERGTQLLDRSPCPGSGAAPPVCRPRGSARSPCRRTCA